MFSKHVLRTFKKKWSTLLLLGVIIFLSSFIYTVISSAVNGLSGPAERFFEETRQEDVSISVLPFLDSEWDACIPDDVATMEALYLRDRACHRRLIDLQVSLFEHGFDDIAFEARLYKDLQIRLDDSRHSLRVFKDTQRINRALIVDGEKPTADDEIAIGALYAENNGLTLNDTLDVMGETYTITGFVLFPDYNLPIIDHPFLFDSRYQALGLMDEAAFDALPLAPAYSIAGVFLSDEAKTRFVDDFETYELFHYATYILTENNIRSGAIYGEIAGSTAMGVFLSVMIALIGIIIVGMVMSKTLNKERGAIGVLKALGVKDAEIRTPYLVFLAVFTLAFLTAGYVVGFAFAPAMRDLFLTFYLLPEDAIPFSAVDVAVAIVVPFVVIMGLSWWIIARLLAEDAFHLLRPKLAEVKPARFKRMQALFEKFGVLTRFQLKQLVRSPAKVAAYVIGIFLAIYAVFLGFSMLDVFERTLPAYYDSIDVKETGFCDPLAPCDATGGEGVIQLDVFVDDERALLIGLDADTQRHPLEDRRGRDLRERLSEGLVISKSFQDLTNVRVGDVLRVEFLDTRFEREVVAVADVYPGAYVFTEREALALEIGADADYFNVVYASEALDEADFVKVLRTDVILEQTAMMNDLVQVMMYVIIGGAFLIGVIVIYILSVLSVEEQFYNISLLKVVGYENAEIHTMMLGGYLKLNALVFLLSVPLGFVSTMVLKRIFIDVYDYMMPLRLLWWHILLTLAMFIATYVLGNLRAKRSVDTVSLQEALKVYQG